MQHVIKRRTQFTNVITFIREKEFPSDFVSNFIFELLALVFIDYVGLWRCKQVFGTVTDAHFIRQPSAVVK